LRLGKAQESNKSEKVVKSHENKVESLKEQYGYLKEQ
jgi:hypothetical protein